VEDAELHERWCYCLVLLLALWLIIELNRMLSCMRGVYFSDFVVGAVVGDLVVDDAEVHERWLPLRFCCWCCGW
jgi:hypothetical protein